MITMSIIISLHHNILELLFSYYAPVLLDLYYPSIFHKLSTIKFQFLWKHYFIFYICLKSGFTYLCGPGLFHSGLVPLRCGEWQDFKYMISQYYSILYTYIFIILSSVGRNLLWLFLYLGYKNASMSVWVKKDVYIKISFSLHIYVSRIP